MQRGGLKPSDREYVMPAERVNTIQQQSGQPRRGSYKHVKEEFLPILIHLGIKDPNGADLMDVGSRWLPGFDGIRLAPHFKSFLGVELDSAFVARADVVREKRKAYLRKGVEKAAADEAARSRRQARIDKIDNIVYINAGSFEIKNRMASPSLQDLLRRESASGGKDVITLHYELSQSDNILSDLKSVMERLKENGVVYVEEGGPNKDWKSLFVQDDEVMQMKTAVFASNFEKILEKNNYPFLYIPYIGSTGRHYERRWYIKKNSPSNHKLVQGALLHAKSLTRGTPRASPASATATMNATEKSLKAAEKSLKAADRAIEEMKKTRAEH